MSTNLKKLFLNKFHEKNGAKFVPFAGYSMPINYPDGIIKEHLHTRQYASLFDVSHMGQIIIEINSENINELKKIIPLDFKNIKINKCYYSFILNQNGGIVDDIILSKIKLNDLEKILIVYNSSRKNIDEKIFFAITSNSKILNENTLIALQGPKSSKILSNFDKKIGLIKFMENTCFNFLNQNIIISRTGYTGEDGFELSVPNNIIFEFINELINYKEIKLCGLGCRDSLRLEAGLSLYGNELNENLSPIQAGLQWAISNKRLIEGDFYGHKIILDQLKKNDFKKKIGIMATNKSMLRSKMKLFNVNGNTIGEITSGGYSPILNKSIAIAYIDNLFEGNSQKIFCFIRNKMEEVIISALPFIKNNYYRGEK